MSKFGIDVSQHQGIINWEIVKGHIDFAILRLGWIGNKNNHTLDNQFERNYSECKRLGIPVGVYVYCYSSNEEAAKSGANWTVEKLKNKNLDLPVYIDMEDASIKGQGKNVLTNICIAFNSIIEASGKWAGVYANLDWFRNYLNNDEIKRRYTTWIAHYGVDQNKYEGQYDVLQYASTGRVTGISGNCDVNIMYRDLVSEIGGSKATVTKKSIEEIANEVIANKWGIGEDRKQRLEAAGYNYEEVQKQVNYILGGGNYYKMCSSKCTSIVDALNSIGVDSSFENRKKIAQKNNVKDYIGTVFQNTQLLNKLKAGRLKK